MKIGFQNHLKFEKIDDDNYKLLSDLTFITKNNKSITVPSGFITNMASCKIGNFALRGSTESPSVLHDYLYEGHVTRKRADALFYEALRDEKVNPIKARIYWFFVRVFGGKHYGKN